MEKRITQFLQGSGLKAGKGWQCLIEILAMVLMAIAIPMQMGGKKGATYLLILAGLIILPSLIMRIVRETIAWDESVKEGFDLYGGGTNTPTCRTLEEFELRLTSLWDIVMGMTLILSEFAVATYLGWRAYLSSGNILFGMVAFGVTLATLYFLHVNYTVCKTRRKIGKLLKRKF